MQNILRALRGLAVCMSDLCTLQENHPGRKLSSEMLARTLALLDSLGEGQHTRPPTFAAFPAAGQRLESQFGIPSEVPCQVGQPRLHFYCLPVFLQKRIEL